jgi:serine/threonine-protein kinase
MEPTSAPLVGQTFGKCSLLGLIGRGGMGSVYLAEHLFLKRRVAIKILSRDLSSDPEEMARFEREAIASAKLDHENIVTIHDVDEERGRPFIVMEYVQGEDLDQRLQRQKRVPIRQAVLIVREVARALIHAHAAGVVHRDIKPGNILLAKNGRIKITDFGLAQRVGESESLTNGTVMGTPFYVSPEQAQGLPADGRSDLYSLGVTFYQMLTGKRPFEGRSADSVVRKHLSQRRPGLLTLLPAAARPLATVVQRLMALRPEDRYESARELLRDLHLFLSDKPLGALLGPQKRVPAKPRSLPAPRASR